MRQWNKASIEEKQEMLNMAEIRKMEDGQERGIL